MASAALLAVMTLMCSQLWARNDRDTIGNGVRVLFSENKGQWDDRVLFRSRMRTVTLFAERDCFTFTVQHRSNANLHHPLNKEDVANLKRYRTHSYRLRFEGCNTASVEGGDRQRGCENYYIGRDRSRWASGVGVYGSLMYHDLYEGIDMKVYTATNAMKYDFIVRPGADAGRIVMSYEGVDGTRLQNGNIIVKTSVADLVELRPYAYQMKEGKQIEVDARYELKDNRVTFKIGHYDTSEPLIIDPYLYFSTYTGSTADNWGTTCCFDSKKNTYSAGIVDGSGYPVSTGAYDGSFNGNWDIGIFKFDSSGSTRLYATYLGGSQADMPHSMYVNSFDELLVFGTTGSADFPVTAGAYNTTFNGGTALTYEYVINFPNGSDIYVSRFNENGSQLQASTFIGGSGNDGLNYRNSFNHTTIYLGNDSLYFNYGDAARGEIITDDQNNVYVGSTTKSLDFPVSSTCIQNHNGGRQDGIVLKLDYSLSHLLWSTYLGGNKDDAVYSLDCDRDYNVVVCGGTNSYNFPTTPGSYRTNYIGGPADGFIAKISYHGNILMASTLYGSSAYDQCYFVRCGRSNDVFIFGQTKALGNTLIYNAGYNTPGSGQMLARFKPALDSLVWATVFGTGDAADNGPNISPTAFGVDICNRVYISGWGRIFLGRSYNSVTYPWYTHGTTGMSVTSNAYQSSTDGQDFYLMSLDIDANQMDYATFFGEPHNTSGYELSGQDHVDGGTSRFDRFGTIYQSVCASCGGSDDFPVTNGAYSVHNNSDNCNNAIFRYNLTDDFPVADFSLSHIPCADNSTSPPMTPWITVYNHGRGASFEWIISPPYNIMQSPSQNDSIQIQLSQGLHTITLVAHLPSGCNITDTLTRQVYIAGNSTFTLDTLESCPGNPTQIGMRPMPGYIYEWIEGNVSDIHISNPYVSLPGRYRLMIINNNCVDTVTQIILPGEAIARIVGDSAMCSVPDTLDIDIDGTGVFYQWSSNRGLTDTLNQNTATGLFSFTPVDGMWLYSHATDIRGCYKNDSVQIHFYNVVDTLEVIPPLCPDGTGYGRVVLTDSTAPPYQWSFGGGPWFPMEQDGPFGLFVVGSQYLDVPSYVTVRDADGCTVNIPYTVPNTPPPIIADSVTHIRCLESCTGAISVTVSGNSVYSLLWLDDSTTLATRTDLCAGDYILQVSDTNGCLFYDTITVLENIDMDVEITQALNTCPGLCNGQATALASGGQAPYSYVWSSGEQTATALQLCEGTAIVEATDAYGCQVRDSIEIGVQHSFDSIRVWADDDFVFGNHSTTLHVTEIAGGSYWWMPSNLLNSPSSPNPVATIQDTTVFVVTVTDSLGCTYTDSLKLNCVNVNCGKPNIFIPNAFTPNNDGKNDRLCFRGEWVQDFHIVIFTRWGEKVYESDDINECWDGRYKDNWCMPGVYVYYCRIKCEDDQTSELKGDVTLIR